MSTGNVHTATGQESTYIDKLSYASSKISQAGSMTSSALRNTDTAAKIIKAPCQIINLAAACGAVLGPSAIAFSSLGSGVTELVELCSDTGDSIDSLSSNPDRHWVGVVSSICFIAATALAIMSFLGNVNVIDMSAVTATIGKVPVLGSLFFVLPECLVALGWSTGAVDNALRYHDRYKEANNLDKMRAYWIAKADMLKAVEAGKAVDALETSSMELVVHDFLYPFELSEEGDLTVTKRLARTKKVSTHPNFISLFNRLRGITHLAASDTDRTKQSVLVGAATYSVRRSPIDPSLIDPEYTNKGAAQTLKLTEVAARVFAQACEMQLAEHRHDMGKASVDIVVDMLRSILSVILVCGTVFGVTALGSQTPWMIATSLVVMTLLPLGGSLYFNHWKARPPVELGAAQDLMRTEEEIAAAA